MMVGKKLRLVLGISSILLMSSTAYATNGYFAHGYGTKNKGMAGGGVALAQDGMISATNPAGIAAVDARMDIGMAVFSPIRDFSATADGNNTPDGTNCNVIPGNACPFTLGGNQTATAVDSDNEAFLIPHFAYVWKLDASANIGVAVYGNGGMNTEYAGSQAQHDDGSNAPLEGSLTTTPGVFGAGTAGVNLEQLFINTTYARKMSEKSSWGISAVLAYQRFEATGLSTFAGFSTDPTKLSNNGVDTSSGIGYKLGVQSELVKNLTLAASYQSEISMSKFDKYSGLFANDGEFDIPATWTAGLAYQSGPRSVVTFDIQHIKYSSIAAIANPMNNLINPSTGCAANVTSRCLGGAEGAGFGWTDMTILKLGWQWQYSTDLVLRAGFSHGQQPIPDSEVVFNILAPAVIEDHLTLGFTMGLSKDSELNFQYMHGFENSVTGANPLNPSQKVTLQMHQNEVEMSWGLRF